jgi:aminocarboxymuconate-semialdehyde decarboxylase
VDRMGPARVLYGTDYPLPAQDDVDGRKLAGLAPREAELVGGGNAAGLLDTLGAAGRLSG